MSAGRIPSTANSPLTAKGDLFSFSTAPARLAVGSDGDTIVADSSTSTGLRYQENYEAGKNKVINGAFDNWQRGTTFTPTSSTYTSDRFAMTSDGTGATRTITQQTFTLGSQPQAGYQGKFFLRYSQTVAGSGGTGNYLFHRIEDVRTFAGQTVTLSFWAKADATRVVDLKLGQLFGTGGSPSSQVDTSLGTVSLTTSFVRYSATVALPSLAGKTIGTDNNDNLQVLFTYPTNATMTIDIWGVQLEAGSVATAFQTATGTIQGELAACQRYYFRNTGANIYLGSGGIAGSATQCYVQVKHPTTMRIAPTVLDTSLLKLQIISASFNVTSSTISDAAPDLTLILANVASGLTATTQSYMLMTQNNAAAHIGLSAEL